MAVLIQAASLALYLSVPAIILAAAHRSLWIRRLGVIVVCYLLGMTLGSAGLLPDKARGVATSLSEVCVVLALPMLLFSLDMRQWSRVAGKALLSLVFAVTAVTALATTLFFVFRDVDGTANLAAMSVGVYSGGTPNLAAIKAGLAIPNEQYLVFHSLDTLLGSVYFLFMLTLGVPLFRSILPRAAADSAPAGASVADEVRVEQDDYGALIKPESYWQLLLPLALSGLVVALSFAIAQGLASLRGAAPNSAVLIIVLTSLAMLLSLNPRVRSLALSYRLGMYLIYVFCLAVSSLVSLEEFVGADALVALFLLVVVFGGLVIHAALCRLAGVDSDTFMVTSVAAVGSPPFVPLMAKALNNPSALLPGMTSGIIGYALGSYLGISLGLYLQRLQ
ncbi:MAG: DUF819 family protein [Pseudomonadota bacterium]